MGHQLVGTWWYWVSLRWYQLVIDGTGSVYSDTGRYLVVLVSIGWYWFILYGTNLVLPNQKRACVPLYIEIKWGSGQVLKWSLTRQGPRSVSEELFGSWLLIQYLSNSTHTHKYWDGNAVYPWQSHRQNLNDRATQLLRIRSRALVTQYKQLSPGKRPCRSKSNYNENTNTIVTW